MCYVHRYYLDNITTENFPPNISADAVFRVNTDTESLYYLTVSDPEDNITLNVQGGLPPNSVLEEFGDGDFIFRWNLAEPPTEPLVFIATDSVGASSSFIPIVEVCACVNSGNCTLDGILTTNSTIMLKCLCPQGTARHYSSIIILMYIVIILSFQWKLL